MLIAGSPCYPRFGALTGAWRSYTQAWRAFRAPVPVCAGAIADATASRGSQGAAEAQVFGCGCAAAGGWLQPGAAAAGAGLIPMGSAGLSASGGGTASLCLTGAAGGGISAAGGALHGVLALLEATGSMLRSVNLPPARAWGGRLTWRV